MQPERWTRSALGWFVCSPRPQRARTACSSRSLWLVRPTRQRQQKLLNVGAIFSEIHRNTADRMYCADSVDPSTTLRTVLWKEVNAVEAGAKREQLRNDGEFRVTEGGHQTPLSLDAAVGSLPEEEKQRVVLLVVPA